MDLRQLDITLGCFRPMAPRPKPSPASMIIPGTATTGLTPEPIFQQAPPIRQEPGLRICAAGPARRDSGAPISRPSLPDRYLYPAGETTTLDSRPSNSVPPTIKKELYPLQWVA